MGSGSAKLCLQVEEPESRRLEPGKGGAGDEGFQWDSLPFQGAAWFHGGYVNVGICRHL